MTHINPRWWYSASTEQRLAQIDAGIDLGMTARQVSLASGAMMSPGASANGGTLGTFASKNGRTFAGTKARPWNKKRSARAAYDHGEPVDFWSDTPRNPVASDDPVEIVFE